MKRLQGAKDALQAGPPNHPPHDEDARALQDVVYRGQLLPRRRHDAVERLVHPQPPRDRLLPAHADAAAGAVVEGLADALLQQLDQVAEAVVLEAADGEAPAVGGGEVDGERVEPLGLAAVGDARHQRQLAGRDLFFGGRGGRAPGV